MGSEQYPKTTACCEAAIVTVRWLGFHRIWQGSGEVFDSVDLFLPDVQFGTQVGCILLPPSDAAISVGFTAYSVFVSLTMVSPH